MYYNVCEDIPYTDIVRNIVQDTFMLHWEKEATSADSTNLGAYLITVAKNNCFYKLRAQRYKQKLFEFGYFENLKIV